MKHPATLEIESPIGEASPSADLDLASVLAAWQSATDRLQSTHTALRDEVRRLSDELERKNHELARKNRLADLGLVASHVAHEVRNSLVPMKLYLSLLRRQMAASTSDTSLLDKFAVSLTALESTVSDLLHFSADRQPHRREFLASELIHDVCSALEPQFEAQGIAMSVDADPAVVFHADYEMLRRALLNLVLNALDVMPRGGRLQVAARVISGAAMELSVADSGPGIDAGAADRVFEPFFSTKSGGTGLGLAVVARIAEAHGGGAAVANRADGGAVFTLRFPQAYREVA